MSAPVGGALFLAVQLSGEAQCGDLSLWPTVCCLWGHCINEVKIASLSRHHLHGHRVASVPVQPPMNESPAAGWKLRSLPLTSLFLLFLFFLLPLPLLPLLPLLFNCLRPNYTKHWPQQTYIPITSQLPHWFTACNVQTYTNCDTFNNAKQSHKKKEYRLTEMVSRWHVHSWVEGLSWWKIPALFSDSHYTKYLVFSSCITNSWRGCPSVSMATPSPDIQQGSQRAKGQARCVLTCHHTGTATDEAAAGGRWRPTR